MILFYFPCGYVPKVRKSPNILLKFANLVTFKTANGMVIKLGKSILRNKNNSKFGHHQNYVILSTLFSKENFLFAVNAFICLKEVAFYKLPQQVNHKK